MTQLTSTLGQICECKTPLNQYDIVVYCTIDSWPTAAVHCPTLCGNMRYGLHIRTATQVHIC
jgi:hypothetical protein